VRSDLKQACGNSSVAYVENNVDGDVIHEVAVLVFPGPVGIVNVQVNKLQGA